MKPISEATGPLELRLRDFMHSLSAVNARFALAMPAVVSPIHRAVENACFAVRLAPGNEMFVKVCHDDMAEFVNVAATAEASRIASALGVGPALMHVDPHRRILAFEMLGSPWRWCRVDDLANRDLLAQVIAAKRQIHKGSRFGDNRSVFDIVRAYAERAAERRAFLPSDVPSLLTQVGRIERAIEAGGIDTTPCHADSIASNIIIGPNGVVRLVDFEWARNADPLYDLGTILLEACQSDEQIWSAVEMFCGRMDDRSHNRARLYGIADDLMWSLWGFLCFATSPRREVEFVKYAEWRLLRARMNLACRRFETWLSRC
jgi:thiamine kinase-like enzyme